MLNMYVNFSVNPIVCDQCGKRIHTGGRVVTDGKYDFDSCQCAEEYEGE